MPVCTATTIKYAQPNATPLPWKACGMAREITRNAAMPSSSRPRRPWVEGGIAFVSQMKASYIHQITASITSTCNSPPAVRWWARLPVSWVMVKTKTRSKKSSSGLTRSANSGAAAGAEVAGASGASGVSGVSGVVAVTARVWIVKRSGVGTFRHAPPKAERGHHSYV